MKGGSDHRGHVIITIGTGDQTPGKIESEGESAKRERRKNGKDSCSTANGMGEMRFK